MPTPVHILQIQGEHHGVYRCEDKAQADGMYNTILEAIQADDSIVELEGANEKVAIRVESIRSFGIITILEPTPEERRERAIVNAERELDCLPVSNYGNASLAKSISRY